MILGFKVSGIAICDVELDSNFGVKAFNLREGAGSRGSRRDLSHLWRQFCDHLQGREAMVGKNGCVLEHLAINRCQPRLDFRDLSSVSG